MTYIEFSETLPPGTKATPFYCSACGVRVRVVSPVDVRSLAALARAFEDAHCECVLDQKEAAEANDE